MGKKVKRGALLEHALDVINGERQDAYGDPEQSFDVIAKFWTTYIQAKFPSTSVVFISSDVAVMMALLKVAREVAGRGKPDNVVDLAGYAGLYGDMRYGVPDGD